MKQKLQKLTMTGIILVLAAVVQAANYSIDWSRVSGGAGTSAGGPFVLSSLVGRPAGGSMQGSRFTLTGSLMNLLAVVPTPGAPPVAITLRPDNSVVVSWPSPSAGFSLQETSTLQPAAWSTVALPVVDDGTTKSVVLNSPVGSRFFRLAPTAP